MPVPRLADLDAVIFDMDGVIIDSEPLHERTATMVFSAHGMTIPPDLFEQFKGRTDRQIVRYMIANHAPGPLDEDALLEERRALYASIIDELNPIPDVLPFIDTLSRSHRLALATSAGRPNQRLAFDKFRLDAYFEVVITADDITRHKPDPEPYLVTAERLGVEPARCLVFEDSVNGVRSALDAGCQVIAITTTSSAEALRATGVAHVAAGFAEIRGWLMP
ncbi:MAG: HAD family phosphatase [Rhodothermales bacterium]